MIVAVSRFKGAVIHALAYDMPEYKETFCGIETTHWTNTRQRMTEGELINSKTCCQRCKRIILG